MKNPVKLFFLYISVFFLLSLNSDSYASIQQAYELFNQGNYDEAETLCNEFLYTNKDVYQAYNLLGAINEARPGAEQMAIINYKKSISLYPNQLNIYQRLGHLYNVLGDTEHSMHYCKEGLKIYPDDFSLNYNLGVLYLMRQNKPFEAVKYLEAAKKHRPKDENLLYITGIASVIIGDKAQALGYITELRALNNQSLASKMEDMMRSMEEGRGVDMPLVAQEYSGAGQDKQALQEQYPQVNISDPQTHSKGKGEVSIKTTLTRKDSDQHVK
jgi:tetratricopeptide (TPR) repeat protein